MYIVINDRATELRVVKARRGVEREDKYEFQRTPGLNRLGIRELKIALQSRILIFEKEV